MAKMVECVCDVCKKHFMARLSDRKRGWARCCSKSCAATQSNRETGKYRKYRRKQYYEDTICYYDYIDSLYGDDDEGSQL